MSTDAKQKDIDLRSEMIRCGYWRCCWNCKHYQAVVEVTDEQKDYFICALYDQLPPENVIPVGCISHELEPPF